MPRPLEYAFQKSVKSTLEFLIAHGHLFVFLAVLADQTGIPLPAIPVLLAAGALSRAGELSLSVSVSLAVVASVIGHLVWFAAGRLRGNQVLELLCRISIEPDACVRKTENLFLRYGAKTLIIAHFVPGLGTVAQPLAGMSGMTMTRFVLLDALGALLWAGAATVLGWVFSDQLEDVAEIAASWGASLIFVLVGLLSSYLLFKYVQRHRLLRSLRAARIEPGELKQMLDRGDPVTVIDVRHDLDLVRNPEVIAGAMRIPYEDFDRRYTEIPINDMIVLYCS
jgi:membrane protein DedA with SNARE-associated domain